MKKSKISHIKRARRTSFLFNELALAFMRIAQDDPQLTSLSLTRTELSDKGSACTAYFTCIGGITAFNEKLSQLLLYKPTLRNAISKSLNSRHCPELVFAYDIALDGARELEAVFDSLKKLEE